MFESGLSIKIAREKRQDGVIISTVKPLAMAWYGNYETAIAFDNNLKWCIAEGYETREAAEVGHQKYMNMSREELETKVDWIG